MGGGRDFLSLLGFLIVVAKLRFVSVTTLKLLVFPSHSLFSLSVGFWSHGGGLERALSTFEKEEGELSSSFARSKNLGGSLSLL